MGAFTADICSGENLSQPLGEPTPGPTALSPGAESLGVCLVSTLENRSHSYNYLVNQLRSLAPPDSTDFQNLCASESPRGLVKTRTTAPPPAP